MNFILNSQCLQQQKIHLEVHKICLILKFLQVLSICVKWVALLKRARLLGHIVATWEGFLFVGFHETSLSLPLNQISVFTLSTDPVRLASGSGSSKWRLGRNFCFLYRPVAYYWIQIKVFKLKSQGFKHFQMLHTM